MHFATKAILSAVVSAAFSTVILTETSSAVEFTAAATPQLPVPYSEAPPEKVVTKTTHIPPSSDAFILGSRTFTIPFTVDTTGTQPTEVRLFVAQRDSANSPNWQLAGSKSPTEAVKQFEYTATTDGEFWFATRTIDATGAAHPDGPVEPQLKVFVDTTKPTVVLNAEADPSGRIDAALEIDDASGVKASQLRFATDNVRQWQDVDLQQLLSDGKLAFTPPDEWAQLSLQFVATDTAGNQSVVTKTLRRPRLAEAQLNRYAMTTDVPGSPVVDLQAQPAPFRFSPSERTPAKTVSNPVVQLDRRRTMDMAANPNQRAIGYSQRPAPSALNAFRGAAIPATAPRNQPQQTLVPQDLQKFSRLAQAPLTPTPPTDQVENIAPPRPESMRFGPPTLFGAQPGELPAPAPATPAPAFELPTPKQVAPQGPTDFGLNAPQRSPEFVPTPSATPEVPVQTKPTPRPQPISPQRARTPAEALKPLSEKSMVPMERSKPKPRDSAETRRYEARRAMEAAAATRAPVRFSDSLRFSLDYELQAVGSLGADTIELYGSVDGGKSWSFWGRDPDRVSPFDIETREEGVFAYRIVVVGKNGLASPRPIAGDTPDIVVVVDKTAPKVRVTGANYGEGDRIGALVIRYECSDANLMQRPIALAFSDSLQGPWTTIAGGLRNDGDYVWPADPNLPRQLYLRIDATDQAGNVGTYVLDKPIDTQGLAPRARIRGFQSLSGRPLLPSEQTAKRPKASFK